MKRTFIYLLAIFLFIAVTREAHAATLYVVSDAKSAKIGSEFSVNIKVDTDEGSINATQAVLHFPSNIVSVVKVDKTNSIFNFWVEEPVASDENGTVSFTAGTTKGVSGNALQVLTIRFKAAGAGIADIVLTDAAVTASDGKGTNILSAVQGVVVTVGGAAVPSLPSPPPGGVPIEQPQIVARPPAPATGLPKKPTVKVPLYPDPAAWYSFSGDAIVLWDVPNDVTQVAVELTKSPNTDPQSIEKELVTGKNFSVLDEGVWYAHVQFRNGIGWGAVSHTRIAIDRTVPLLLEIVLDAVTSDNPSPRIIFNTQDSLSGIRDAALIVDGREVARATGTVAILPPQPPGKHRLLVRVFDYAGNSIEGEADFEVLSLPTPIIYFVARSVEQGEPILVSGKTLPDGMVLVRLTSAAGAEAATAETRSDGLGSWQISMAKTLPTGKYVVTAIVRDSRGASSYPSEPQSIKVRAKTILSLGVVDLGWFEIFIILVLLVVAGASCGAWYYLHEQVRRQAYATIAGRDIDKIATIISEEVKAIGETLEKDQGITARTKAETGYRFKKIEDTIAKMRKYLGKEVEETK